MRFFEFADTGMDRFIMVLRNYIGRAASKKAPVKLNWVGLNHILGTNGFEVTADYETFKAMYDGSPAIQALVKNFNQDGIELNVPGAPGEEEAPVSGQTPADKVDQMASGAVAGQMDQNQQGVQV